MNERSMDGPILILGSSGFIARRTIAALEAEEVNLVTVSRREIESGSHYQHIVGNCLDLEFLSSVIGEIEPRIILSFIGGPTCDGDYSDLVNFNCGVLQLLSRMPLRGARVISLGSAAEYGASDEEYLTEEQVVAPKADYGYAKAAQTALALGLNAALGLNVSIIRAFNLFGANTPDAAISEKINQRVKDLNEDDDLILDDPEMLRDFIDVADVASALVAFMKAAPEPGVYNLCTGRATSLGELAKAFMLAHGKNGSVKIAEQPKFKSPVRRAVGSPEKFARATGWSSQLSLHDSARAQAR